MLSRQVQTSIFKAANQTKTFNLIHTHSVDSLALIWTLTSVSCLFIICDWKFSTKGKEVHFLDFMINLLKHLKENNPNYILKDRNDAQNQLLDGQDQENEQNQEV